MKTVIHFKDPDEAYENASHAIRSTQAALFILGEAYSHNDGTPVGTVDNFTSMLSEELEGVQHSLDFLRDNWPGELMLPGSTDDTTIVAPMRKANGKALAQVSA